MDEVFKALADPTRRQLLDSLNARSGQTLRDLCAGLSMTRQSVSKHLAALEAANLVTTAWRGREKLHHLNPEPISAISERWINRYDRARVHALADLKSALEARPMTNPEFVYTTYIRTTPERLWHALTEPAFTSRYWMGVSFESDWKPGSTIIWRQGDRVIADPDQVIVESEPYRRLSYTWHSMTPEWADANGISEDDRVRWGAEPRSTVTFDIEPAGETVKLTVIHTGFEPGSKVLDSVSGGWPVVLSGLKTFLETGEALPAALA